jgi:hypothetical protein
VEKLKQILINIDQKWKKFAIRNCINGRTSCFRRNWSLNYSVLVCFKVVEYACSALLWHSINVFAQSQSLHQRQPELGACDAPLFPPEPAAPRVPRSRLHPRPDVCVEQTISALSPDAGLQPRGNGRGERGSQQELPQLHGQGEGGEPGCRGPHWTGPRAGANRVSQVQVFKLLRLGQNVAIRN